MSDDPVQSSAAAPPLGLTSDDARRRLAERPTDRRPRGSRSYADIVWSNVATVFNLILGSLLVLILLLGSWRDGLFGGVIAANTLIGIVQEIRAKRTLDRLALLVAPSGRVWRDGELATVHPDRIVQDDVLHLRPGDQVVADGVVVDSRGLELDESVLTGESEPVHGPAGREIRSGAYCVAGSGDVRVTAAAADSYAERLAAEAKGTRIRLSPLQLDINRVLRATVWVMGPLALFLIVALAIRREPFVSGVHTVVAALVPLVPEGLVLLTSLTFAVAAVRLGRLGAIAQRLNAVESLAGVDMVCIDKTGTLTDNRPRMIETIPASGVTDEQVLHVLGAIATAAGDRNATMQAIAEATAPVPVTVVSEVPFTSQRKWSGVMTDTEGAIVLGAPDILERAGVAIDPALRAQIDATSGTGRRVVLVARGSGPLTGDAPPADAVAVGAAVMSEGIRPDAIETVRFLARQGTEIKVISGDNPHTVAVVAAECGIDVRGEPVDGSTLPDDPDDLERVAAERTVFGRITPHQKRDLIQALDRRGHHVAMIGDGVNDVLALKEANLAIAIGTGSQMAKGVADLVLLNGEFSTVPRAIEEGRRILRNTHRVAKLFVSKTVYAALVLVVFGLLPVAFPFLPRHLSVTSSLTIGIPAFFLALAPSSGPVDSTRFLRELMSFTIPVGAVVAAAIASVYGLVRGPLEGDVTAGRTAAVIVATALGLAIVVILERETGGARIRAWVGVMVAAFAAAFGGGLALGPVRDFFAVSVPTADQWTVIAAVIAAATALMVGIRRFARIERLIDRFARTRA